MLVLSDLIMEYTQQQHVHKIDAKLFPENIAFHPEKVFSLAAFRTWVFTDS